MPFDSPWRQTRAGPRFPFNAVMLMKVIVFEDQPVWNLYPITIGRGAFAITCGSLRMIDVVLQIPSSAVGFLCRPYLEGISRYDYSEPGFFFGQQAVQTELANCAPNENILLLNARMVPNIQLLSFFRNCIRKNKCCAFPWQTDLACACIPAERLLNVLKALPEVLPPTAVLPIDFLALTRDLPQCFEHPLELFDYPHDVVRSHVEIFNSNLEYRIQHTVPAQTGRSSARWTNGKWTEIRDGVFVGENVRLGDYLVTDTTQGPILVDEGASIGPFCYLKGPVYVGPYSKVIEHAALKDFVGLAHTTKVGGEVEASAIEPYTNKQHHGFLGHSYLGSWINLGAGTCNSDLKNTYGSVSMQYKSGRVATTMQFLGCIIGDYAKTAINTSIFTGKTIGSCSMVYGFVTRNVPCFVNYARSFGQCTELPVEVMISTQQRMFERRNVRQEKVHVDLLHQMFSLSTGERQMENEPLSL